MHVVEIGEDAETEAAIRAACQGNAAGMILKISAGIDQHNENCEHFAKAILFHPANHELIGWDEVFGLPALADPRVKPNRFRIVCRGCGGTHQGQAVHWDESGTPYLEAETDG